VSPSSLALSLSLPARAAAAAVCARRQAGRRRLLGPVRERAAAAAGKVLGAHVVA